MGRGEAAGRWGGGDPLGLGLGDAARPSARALMPAGTRGQATEPMRQAGGERGVTAERAFIRAQWAVVRSLGDEQGLPLGQGLGGGYSGEARSASLRHLQGWAWYFVVSYSIPSVMQLHLEAVILINLKQRISTSWPSHRLVGGSFFSVKGTL